MDPALGVNARPVGSLPHQRVRGVCRQPVRQGLQRRILARQLGFDRLLAQHGLVGQPHAIGRQHARERVDEQRVHAKFVGHQAGVLPAGPAEALQREPGGVMALFQRHLLDRVGHVGDRDAQKTLRGHPRILTRHQFGEFRPHDIAVQRLIGIGAENGGEVPGLDLPHHHVRVRHRQRPTPPVTGRAGSRTGAVRPDPVARAVEMQHRTATGRHGVDRHHGRTDAHAGHRRLERPLERAVVERHVGRCAAHVEADDPVEPRPLRRARRADDAAGRAGQDRVLAAERRRLRQPATRLHEIQLHAGQLARHLVDVAPQDRRQIGVDHRRVAPRNDPQQRARRVAGRDLGKPRRPRQLGQALLVGRVLPRVHQHDGAGMDAVGHGSGERRAGGGLVQRLDLDAVHIDAATNLNHPLVQQARQLDVQVEQARAGLVADAQRVRKPAVHDQERALPPPFQQRVGGDGGAHLHAVDGAGRDGRVRRQPEHATDAGDRRVAVAGRVLAQQLMRGQCAGGVPCHDVGERAATIDPELPARHRHPPPRT